MVAVTRKLKPGETIFGGGRGMIALGRREPSSTSKPTAPSSDEPPVSIEQAEANEMEAFARSNLRAFGIDPDAPSEKPDPAPSE